MNATRLGTLTITCVLTALSAVGCCDKEKNLIAALQTDNKKLTDTKASLQSENAALKSRQKDLLDQLDAKDVELLSAKQRIDALEAGKVKAPETAKATKEGEWDIGLHADRISVTGDILFPAGKADLTPAGRTTLNRIIATLRTKYPGMPVRVYGYTDADPIRKTKNLWKDNLDLSANRAMAVTRHLRTAGIAAESIETVAMGEAHPVAANSSTSGKAKNRRVEIVVIKG